MCKSADKPVVSIAGSLVLLGPMNPEQVPTYHRWLNDFDTLRTQGEPAPLPDTIDAVRGWYENYVRSSSNVAWFTIYEKESRTPIGWTELKDIDHHHGTAEFAIMIGEPEMRGRGIGSEVTKLMVTYGFEHLGLHNIHLYYMEFNPAAGRAYEKAGFREYGRRTGAHWSGGRRWDVVYMECVAPE